MSQHDSTAIDLVVIDTPSGMVRGSIAVPAGAATAVATFKGIPFAKPPVGELRFAAPEPVDPWTGVLDALEFGPTAQRGDPGVTLIPEPSVPGEATLNVNVTTPAAGDPSAALPVLVWIHGGGYFAGSPASPWYSSPAFARDGVVTVVISYRLGFDGFGHIPGAPSNRGIRDWLCALEWVRDHISSFGGDPNRVTIAGQSAGGGAVLTLLGIPASRGLFHQVIALSSAVGDVSAERAAALSQKIATAAGVSCDRAGFSSLSEDALLKFQKEATDITSAKAMTKMMDDGLGLGPTVDGDLITRQTLESLASGEKADVPLLINAADDEFGMAFADAPGFLKLIPAGFMLARMGAPRKARRDWLAANQDARERGTTSVMGRYISDKFFKVGLAEAVAHRGNAPTWVSRFSWRSPVFNAAVHCIDVPFFFDCLDSEKVAPLAGEHPPQELADTVHSAALAFITTGNPGWAPYLPGNITMVYDNPRSETMQDGYASVDALRPAALAAV